MTRSVPGITGFFRDAEHFAAVTDALRRRARSAMGPPTVWSVGCAAGQEPYSLAMVALEWGEEIGALPRILATDVDEEALQVARTGAYDAAATAQVPARYRERCFGPAGTDGMQHLGAGVRRLVEFRRHDLIEEEPPPDGPFAAILCRHLLMHCDEAQRERIVARLRSALEPGGLLVIGFQEELPTVGMEYFTELDRGVHRLSHEAELRSPEGKPVPTGSGIEALV